MTQKLENNQMNVIFRSDETVFVSGGGLNRKYGGNTNISLAIKENGVYDFTFADAAGNMTQQQIMVDSIDEIPPVVYASGIPETYIRSEDCSVKVTMSEAGTITFRGKEYPVKAPTDKNGDGELKEMNWTGSHFRSRQTEVIRSKQPIRQDWFLTVYWRSSIWMILHRVFSLTALL